jgi:hypothetical protein
MLLNELTQLCLWYVARLHHPDGVALHAAIAMRGRLAGQDPGDAIWRDAGSLAYPRHSSCALHGLHAILVLSCTVSPIVGMTELLRVGKQNA